MKTEQQIIAEELAKHGVKPIEVKTTKPEPALVETNEINLYEPTKEDKEVEELIQKIDKPKKVSISLTPAEVAGLEREARVLGLDWKTHLQNLIQDLLTQRTGKTLISKPSWGAKITGSTDNTSSVYS